jgi:hypothetical protein
MSSVAFTRAVSVKTRTWTSDPCCTTATTSSPPESPELSLCWDYRVGRVTCGLVVAVSGDVEDDEGEVWLRSRLLLVAGVGDLGAFDSG